jgi:hypothetical protein
VSAPTVLAALRRHEIAVRPVGAPPGGDGRLDDPVWLGRRHHEDGVSVQGIADELGVAAETVVARLERHGVEVRRPADRREERLAAVDLDVVRVRHHRDGESVNRIASALGVRPRDLRALMLDGGVEVLSRRQLADRGRLADREWLAGRYLADMRTLEEIGKEVGVSASTVGRWLVRHGIAVRPSGPVPRRRR